MQALDTMIARPDALAISLKHLIDEIILVFPEGSDAEDAEIQGRICLRLLEQAQQEAERLYATVMQMPVPLGPAERSQPMTTPIVICQR